MAKQLVGYIGGGVSPEQIASAVETYLDANPVSADEPLLALHIADTTPHPVYDDLVTDRFVDKFRNGMA